MTNIEVVHCRGEKNWTLLLDSDGSIAEGTGDNLFVVKDGQLLTQKGSSVLRSSRGCHGTRDMVGLGEGERNLETYDAHAADEAFMTGTPFCLWSVTGLNGLPLGAGAVGSMTARLLAAWSGAKAPSPYSFR